MRKTVLLISLFIGTMLNANYCIQVLTSNISDKNSVIRQAKSRNYSEFDAVRVERRGRYVVLRIGDYNNYHDASVDIYDIQGINEDAYIRKCDYLEEKVLYENNQHNNYEEKVRYVQKKRNKPQRKQKVYKKVEYVEEPYYETEVIEEPVVVRKKTQPTYKQKKELKYENTQSTSSSSLWSDCKKCFVPIYEDETDITYDLDK